MEQSQPAQVSKVRIYGKMGSSISYMIRDFSIAAMSRSSGSN
jgi:hypothetical protein